MARAIIFIRMSPESFCNQEQLQKPDFSYDPSTAEATIALPQQARMWLNDAVVIEDGVQSTVTGRNENDELVKVELVDAGTELEVTKVIIHGSQAYAVTKH